MPNFVKVAVFIDRSEAIRAGRNKWGWQNTKLDLETLASDLRDALSRCPEKSGALRITHAAQDTESWRSSSYFERHRLQDIFELEREGMPTLVEATPTTALQILEHLTSLPSRLRVRGTNQLAAAEARATARGERAMKQVESHLAELDLWLGTACEELIVVNPSTWDHSKHFDWVRPPNAPLLKTIEDEEIVYDLEEAQRLIGGERPRISTLRPGSRDSGSEIFGVRPDWTPPSLDHLAAAESALLAGTRAREALISQHRRDLAAEAQERSRAWQRAEHERAEEERRAAAKQAAQVMEAHKNASSNQAVREWASSCGKSEIVELLDAGAPAEEITSKLRSVLFEPLDRFKAFRKLKKTDLLIANPNFDGSGLEAVFDEIDEGFTDPSDKAEAQVIMLAAYDADIPVQFDFRLHRGRLARRGDTVGVLLAARSVLVTAQFGNLKISRAYSVGTMGPIPPEAV